MAADFDHALRMPATERAYRHRMLSAALEREGDAMAWVERFLARLAPRAIQATG